MQAVFADRKGVNCQQTLVPVNHCVIGGDDTVSGDFTVGWKNIHHEGRRSLRTAENPVGVLLWPHGGAI